VNQATCVKTTRRSHLSPWAPHLDVEVAEEVLEREVPELEHEVLPPVHAHAAQHDHLLDVARQAAQHFLFMCACTTTFSDEGVAN
jgi:hypothetical protein